MIPETPTNDPRLDAAATLTDDQVNDIRLRQWVADQWAVLEQSREMLMVLQGGPEYIAVLVQSMLNACGCDHHMSACVAEEVRDLKRDKRKTGELKRRACRSLSGRTIAQDLEEIARILAIITNKQDMAVECENGTRRLIANMAADQRVLSAQMNNAALQENSA